MKNILLTACILLGSVCLPPSASAASLAPKNEISRAEYYLREFEKEVAHQHGGAAMFYRNKRDAVDRVKRLVQGYPDDPAVKALFQRTRTALLESKGDYMEITPDMTAYLRNEQEMRERFGRQSAEAWKKKLATVKSVPPDVSPEGLMEIFQTAIKEKNFELYQSCINPARWETPTGESLVRYHWDLHQARFQKQYVHAVFDKAKIKVVKGHDSRESQSNSSPHLQHYRRLARRA